MKIPPRHEVEAGVTAYMQRVESLKAELRSKHCYDAHGVKLTKPFPYLMAMTPEQMRGKLGKWFDRWAQLHAEHNARCLHCGQLQAKTSEAAST